VAAFVRERLAVHNAEYPAASTRICRVALQAEPPSLDANEVTDKGYINQRAVLERRAKAVEALYAAQPGPEVIVCE
jgi:feruloyl-CoA synthase